jgi:hypothetical protein
MNEVMKAFIQYMVAYGGLTALIFFVINFLQKGYLFTFLSVKASQGKKILARVHSPIDIYYRSAKWEDGFLKFKNRGKEEKAIELQETIFKRLMSHTAGVGVVDIDEAGNKIVDINFDVVKFNVDSGRLNTTLIRIKNRPVPKSKQETTIIVIVGIILLIALFTILKVISIEKAIMSLAKLSGNV